MPEAGVYELLVRVHLRHDFCQGHVDWTRATGWRCVQRSVLSNQANQPYPRKPHARPSPPLRVQYLF